MSAPVPYTCPKIDKIIASINESSKSLQEYIDSINRNTTTETDESDISSIQDIINVLNDLTHRRGYIEEVREANHALREWGSENESKAERLESDLDSANYRISDLESDIESKDNEIQTLNSENNDLLARICELENQVANSHVDV